MKEKFSLKDQLFNRQKVEKIAAEIQAVYSDFDAKPFVSDTVSPFPNLELKQRLSWIATQLNAYLPNDYPQALSILIQALPAPCNPLLSDNDFGEFIYAPYADFVAKYGCKEPYVELSLAALQTITTRFSAEDAIRGFINQFPDITLKKIAMWTQDPHYHVRRLASEGTRPKLPWSQKITLHSEQAIPLLDALFFDKTRFVTRSVANHLNDISKINPELVLSTLTRWKESQKQDEKELALIIRHALRTLIKKGHPKAIEFLDFSSDPAITLAHFSIQTPDVLLGGSLAFDLSITAQQDERLIIDYQITFQNKAGILANKKVYKLKQLDIKAGETVVVKKNHVLRADMSTRALYPGTHRVDIQINGKWISGEHFELKQP